MGIGEKGVKLIKDFEGCKLTAYLCPAKVWTVGYGATGQGIKQGTTWTQQQAEDDLKRRGNILALWLDGQLKRPANQNQKDAMISLIYNIGQSAFKNSSVLRHFNDGKTQMASDAFLLWNKATLNGKKEVLAGLQRRREAERNLFNGN
jgi:lysozyme